MLETGSLLEGKYRILHEIGRGGMSTVYLALHERMNKTWAVKEIRRSSGAGTDLVCRGLIAETQILKKLRHPHLPGIVDVIEREDSILVVMDYVEGISLARLLHSRGRLDWQEVVEWGRQLCDVLAYLHSRRPPIIYRDMKPGNIQLGPDGNVTLLDFGTAREYKFKGRDGNDTVCLGTRGYAAPEQYGGLGETDARTDIYCLGATLYHLLTGHNPGLPPYEMKPIRQLRPDLPAGLEAVISRCIQQDPDLRYQNCTELLYDLTHIDRLNRTYRRGLQRRFAIFTASMALSVSFACAGLISRQAARSRSDQQYERYMRTAVQAAGIVRTPSDQAYLICRDACEEAIHLQPRRPDAWLALCGLYVKDGDGLFAISPQEEARMRSLINSSRLELDPDAYAPAAFCWGSYLFFYYRDATAEGSGEGNARLARIYLEAAAAAQPRQLSENEEEGEAMQELAGAMSRICRGEALLDMPAWTIVTTGQDYDLQALWEDLDQLILPDLISRIRKADHAPVYLLGIYRKTAAILYERMADLSVSRNQILDLADRIGQGCEKLSQTYAGFFEKGSEGAGLLEETRALLEAVREKAETLQQGE